MTTISLVAGAARGLGRTTTIGISHHGGDVVSTYRQGAEDAQASGVAIETLGCKAVAPPLGIKATATFPPSSIRREQAIMPPMTRSGCRRGSRRSRDRPPPSRNITGIPSVKELDPDMVSAYVFSPRGLAAPINPEPGGSHVHEL